MAVVTRLLALVLTLAVMSPALGAGQSANGKTPQVAFIHIESPAKRMQYLATAQIWADPGELTPEALFAGPPLEDGSGLEKALDGHPFPCTFTTPGRVMGGNTPKFLCTTDAGQTIRVKYTDGSKNGNREVFAAVAASRVLWALGFKSDPIYPIAIDCRDCPRDPMTGKGPIAQRPYLAIYQPQFTQPVMVDRSEQNQGWKWAELDRAIDSLPEGELRSRQRQYFDALMLAGVILQHGDRKPEQQRLGCRGLLNLEAGDIRTVEPRSNNNLPVFFERPGATACDSPDVAVQDMGATFGGAGRRTNAATAKMNLRSWTARPVFYPAAKAAAGAVPECRGQLTVSMAAGAESLANPRIGEAGRLFLLDRLRRLTDDHLRAIFTAARVEKMTDDHTWRDPENATAYTGIDAWIAAAKYKVRQIQERTCAP